MPRRAKDEEREDHAETAPRETAAARPGLPDPTSVVSEKEFTSPKGGRYRVLRTTETDAYEESPLVPPDQPARP